MKRLASLKTIIFFNLLFSYLSLFSQAEEKMNVLFIAVDDLKPSIGSFGDEFAVTPNIDELSKSSTVFLNNHTQQAICGPSRASLMTGLRPDKTRVWDLKTKMRDMNPDIVTIPQYFKQNGYQTIGIGKIYDNRCVDNFKDKPSWFVALREVAEEKVHSKSQEDIYAEESIYTKFTSNKDTALFPAWHAASWKDKLKLLDKFEDDRLVGFGKKIIYQEAPETLPPDILKSMKRDIAKRILSERKEKWWTIPTLYTEIDTLREKYTNENDEEKLNLLDEFNNYAMSIQKKYENA